MSPCCTKKVGSQVTKPKIRVLIEISTTQPTIMRCRIGGLIREPRRKSVAGAAGAGAGSVPPAAASRSMNCISASASAVLPCASSQRGDSGSVLRKYQTMSAPIPAMTNIGRQPNVGITNVPINAVAGSPETTSSAMVASRRPRSRGGTNSVRVE